MAKPDQHHLEWTERPWPHKHRWQPRCSCGKWAGIPMKTKRKGALQHRLHVKQAFPNKRRGGRRPAMPRPVTPTDRLPEELRP